MVWCADGKLLSRSTSPPRNGGRCWRGSGRPRFLLAVQNGRGLFYSWLMGCPSLTLLPRWGSTDALCTSGQSVFSTKGWRGSSIALAVAAPGAGGNKCSAQERRDLLDTLTATTLAEVL